MSHRSARTSTYIQQQKRWQIMRKSGESWVDDDERADIGNFPPIYSSPCIYYRNYSAISRFTWPSSLFSSLEQSVECVDDPVGCRDVWSHYSGRVHFEHSCEHTRWKRREKSRILMRYGLKIKFNHDPLVTAKAISTSRGQRHTFAAHATPNYQRFDAY